MKEFPKDFDQMVAFMLTCNQTEWLTVYQHGQMVYSSFNKILDHLRGIEELNPSEWRLPEWISAFKDEILDNLHSEDDIHDYLVYHDCGKPQCMVEDSYGNRKFPDHAAVSREVWHSVSSNVLVEKLIGDDMVIHVSTSDEIQQKLDRDWSVKDSITLLLASLAEVHANASMFGGIQSNSFKMKFKQIDRRGKQICKFYFQK